MTKNTRSLERVFLSKPTGLAYHQPVRAVYHCRTCAAYIITRSVYFCRLDDIQVSVLMICNSYGIDDIQRQAVDFSLILCYNVFTR